MKDKNKTKAQLIAELTETRQRVSELEQSETERGFAEEKFRIISDSAPDAHYLYDLKGKFIDGNKAAERITGYRKEELIGENFLKIKILPKNQLPRVVAALAKNALGKPTGPDEFTLIRKDGSKVEVEIVTRPVTIEGKNLVLGTARDITKRVQAKQALKKSEEKFAKAFHSNPAIAGLSDLETGEYVEVNQAFCDKLGFTPEEVIGKIFTEVVQMDLKFRDRVISKMKRQGYIKNEEAIIYHKNGTLMNMLFFAEIIEIAGKKYNFTTAIDITEFKRSEAALQESEEELQKSQALYRQAERMGKMGYWGWNYQENRMDSCSQQFARIFEMAKDEALEFFSNPDIEFSLIHPDDRVRFEQHLIDTREQRKGMDIEYRVILRSGAVRHVHIQSELVLGDQGEIIKSFGTIRDITQRVQVEKHVKQQAAETAVLFSVSQMLAQAPPDSDEIALIMARQFVDVVGFPEASIALYEPRDDTLRFMVDYYDPKDVAPGEENWTGKVIAMSDYPNMVRVQETLKPQIIQADNPNNDSTVLAYMKDTGVKTMAFFPMVVKDRFIGIIELESWFEDYHFASREIDLAMALANQAAVALESAQMYETAQHEISERKKAEAALRRRAEEMTALQATVLGITSSTSLPELLQSIVERATGLFNASGGGLYLAEPEYRRVRCVVSYKTPQDYTGTELAYGEGAAGRVAQTGKPLFIDDYRTWSGRADAFEEEQPFQTIISAPLIWRGEVVGVIHVLHEGEQGEFSQEDLNLLSLFADHAAVAVENARLYASIEQELSERKQAEQALQQERNRAEKYLDIAGVMFVTLNIKGDITLINRKGSETLGYEQEEIIGKNWFDSFLPVTIKDQTRAIFDRLMTGEVEPVESFENPVVTKGGEERIIAWHNIILVDDEGNIIGTLSSGEDITERKQAEEKLRESEERYRALFNSVPVGIYRSTPEGRFLDGNPALLSILGYADQETLLAVDIRDLYLDESAREQELALIDQDGVVSNHRIQLRRYDGAVIWVQDSVTAVRDNSGQTEYYYGRLEDITERVWTEMELQRANKQLNKQLTEIRELEVALREQAIRDPLTGVFNRRYMDEALQQELARAARKEGALSVVILDLDYLKDINDTYGHVTGGDKALQTLADTLKQVCRDEDTLCRYGGDEFLVILYDTPAQVAYERASQWQETVGKIKITSNDKEFGITFSAGVAAFPAHGSTGEGILTHADQALYRAKELGRNQVVVYQQGSLT